LGAASDILTQEERSNKDRRTPFKKLNYLHFLLNIIQMMKVRKVIEGGHVKITKKIGNVYAGCWWEI